MNDSEVSAFVERLSAGKVKPEEFRELSYDDWREIRCLLEARRRYTMQKYVNAMYVYRMKANPNEVLDKYIFTEEEILGEFGN